ncbi:MAG: hypothetical protein R3F11_20465 [Verrucomicrobiales bacterium]
MVTEQHRRGRIGDFKIGDHRCGERIAGRIAQGGASSKRNLPLLIAPPACSLRDPRWRRDPSRWEAMIGTMLSSPVEDIVGSARPIAPRPASVAVQLASLSNTKSAARGIGQDIIGVRRKPEHRRSRGVGRQRNRDRSGGNGIPAGVGRARSIMNSAAPTGSVKAVLEGIAAVARDLDAIDQKRNFPDRDIIGDLRGDDRLLVFFDLGGRERKARLELDHGGTPRVSRA